MGVDDIDPALTPQPPEGMQAAERHEETIPCLEQTGNREESWQDDLNSFLYLKVRRLRPKMRPENPYQTLERKPRNWYHHGDRQSFADSKQPFANKKTGARSTGMREQI